ncbi:MAG: hypothetical protein WBQ10_16410 [Terriglobales bacterium]
MKFCFVLFLATVLVPNLHAAEKPFFTGKILDVQHKTTTRVLYYQVDTPITKDEPYYEVSVQVKDTIYVGDYSPRHASATLPDEWNVPQTEVRVRLDKHYMFLTRPAGTEVQFVIVKRMAAAPAQNNSEPPSPKK